MIKSKVFEILNSLSKEEFKRFYDFVCSPYFNKKDALIKLTQVYKDQHPDFDDVSFTKEIAFKKIFPDKEFNDEVFRNLNSDLFKLSEGFLSLHNFYNNPTSHCKHLLPELNFRNLYNIFKGNYENGIRILESNQYNTAQYFLERFILQSQKEVYNTLTKNFSSENLQEYEMSIINLFLSSLLEIHSYILNTCKAVGLDYDTVFLKNKLNEMMFEFPKEITENPRIQILYNLYKLIESNQSKYYYNLKDLLDKFGNLIDKVEMWQMYISMLNYIRSIDPKLDFKIEYVAESFELRKRIIENDLIPKTEYIQHIFFRNLVRSGLRLKKFDWISNFINNYQHRLNPIYRESTIELCFGMFYFYKKEFEKSMSHLSRVKYEERSYNLEVKNLNARIYYEMNEFDLLENLISAYSMFLSKSKTTKELMEESHRKFVNNLVKLSKIKQKNKFYKLNSLKKQIQSDEFTEKNWLLEKIDELNPKMLKNIKAN